MKKATTGVTEKLLAAAEKEFLQYGFTNASLRRISADCGVSTNSIYTRFHDKADLFNAIVKPAADGLLDIYLSAVRSAENSNDVSTAEQHGIRGTDCVLEYIYENFNAFKLIFCCSAGTEYEHFFDKLSEIEASYYRIFADKYSRSGERLSDFFIHVVCASGWQYMYEIVSHALSFEEAREFMLSIGKFNYAGWESVLGVK